MVKFLVHHKVKQLTIWNLYIIGTGFTNMGSYQDLVSEARKNFPRLTDRQFQLLKVQRENRVYPMIRAVVATPKETERAGYIVCEYGVGTHGVEIEDLVNNCDQ